MVTSNKIGEFPERKCTVCKSLLNSDSPIKAVLIVIACALVYPMEKVQTNRQTVRLTNEGSVDCESLCVGVPEVGGTEEHHVSGHGVEDETLAQLHHEDTRDGELPVPRLQGRRGLVRRSDPFCKCV